MANSQKRAQMVKGTTWSFTQDLDIYVEQDNPAYLSALENYRKQNGYYDHQNPSTSRSYDQIDRDGHEFLKSQNIPKTLTSILHQVKAGEQFEITDKSTTFLYWKGSYLNGLFYPVRFKGIDTFMPYKGVEPYISPVGEISISEYVIRNKTTGAYYAGFDTWDSKNKKELPGFAWAPTYMKGKRFKDLGKLKSHILQMTGYYDGMPDSKDIPEWIGGPKKFDLPLDWEFVKFDKLNKKDLEVIDPYEWYNRTMKLRTLTMQFGPPVRSLYNQLEKKGKLGDFKSILTVRAPIENTAYSYSYYPNELDPEKIAEINNIIEDLKLKKTEIKRVTDDYCIAIAVSSITTALQVKLKYQGNLELKVLSLDTLTEIIDSQTLEDPTNA